MSTVPAFSLCPSLVLPVTASAQCKDARVRSCSRPASQQRGIPRRPGQMGTGMAGYVLLSAAFEQSSAFTQLPCEPSPVTLNSGRFTGLPKVCKPGAGTELNMKHPIRILGVHSGSQDGQGGGADEARPLRWQREDQISAGHCPRPLTPAHLSLVGGLWLSPSLVPSLQLRTLPWELLTPLDLDLRVQMCLSCSSPSRWTPVLLRVAGNTDV